MRSILVRVHLLFSGVPLLNLQNVAYQFEIDFVRPVIPVR
jgi:hypothetical protein